MSQPDAPAGTTDVTLLLARWRQGDSGAFERAAEVIYPELHRIAEAYLRRERAGHTLQPTALIHELFLRLTKAGSLQFESRKQFYALSAQLMRRILVDHARAVNAAKRGGRNAAVSLETLAGYTPDFAEQFLSIHEALDQLAGLNARKAQVIELRYFAGLNLEEIAELLGVSVGTVHRDQRLAEAWLTERLAG